MSIKSLINVGFESVVVDVECSITSGLPTLTIVGLASKSVDEAKERIRAALHSSGLNLPRKRVVINLAPADLPKDATSLDVAIAIAILRADGQLTDKCEKDAFIGELGLDSSIKPVRGIIGKLSNPKNQAFDSIYVPNDNKNQVKLLNLPNIYPVNTLLDIIRHLSGASNLRPLENELMQSDDLEDDPYDFGEIYGQETAKRALIIAACGGHNVLMSGPPGTGKSMLAKAFCSILPDLTIEQSLEVTNIHSLNTANFDTPIFRPPFRSPHHTASDVAIIGGGHNLKPGEVSLAHNGVLFLDELPEFRRPSLEALRQPLEDSYITISRAQNNVTFPSDFVLVATRNPCPCGYLNSEQECTCTANQINGYNKKISGPILDRIDMHVFVGKVEHNRLLSSSSERKSPEIKKLVAKVRAAQVKRQSNKLNSRLTNKQLKTHSKLENEAQKLLNDAAESLKLSPRGYMRTVKLARTIADIEESDNIKVTHIAEAIQYRPKSES